ncbi:uncharacterized protein LOC109841860 [Asparagus officinalis]|uniref:uncharacterized protein LOC109841860 n=1 Tax=Asparagus officinalis TaxID=4686 RepID=UPI00098E42BF|nr:uncharacterized protein LOC109841860 [Asparagus officinalis]
MFTEGLDQNAINWVKQDTDVAQRPRSPLTEYQANSSSSLQLLCESSKFYSPKSLPPLKFNSGLISPAKLHSGLLGLQPSIYTDSEDENESVGSPEGFYAHFSDNYEDEDSESFDSLSCEKSKNATYDEEVISAHDPAITRQQRPLARGLSKENLRVNVTAARNSILEQNGLPDSRGSIYHDCMSSSFQELGTPSAPPIAESEIEGSELEVEDLSKPTYESVKVSSDLGMQKTDELPPRTTSRDGDMLSDQMPCYTTSVQSAWQSFVAYDACFRLCLNSWAKNCIEATEFLRDECMVLRNAFGIQKFLLQPRGHIQEGGRSDNTERTCSRKGKNVIEQVKIEVKRVRMVPWRRRLRATSSQRDLYLQMGAEYVKHVTTIMKSHLNSLKSSPLAASTEEAISCSLQLKSSGEGSESGSLFYLRPGSGDSHVFYPENPTDALYIEVRDINKGTHGRAIVEISSLADHHGEVVRWWPLYLGDHECIGKVELCISVSGSSEKANPSKGGPVVETLIYDMVLEAAMRAQHFHPKNLHTNGVWKWLLNEFADYYGVSEAYTKLRYLSNVMNIATPTKECLELIYELLLPVVKARSEKSLTRQERSILLDCEDQIKMLLATTFQNYKSLDELSPTGLTDIFGPIPESAAPALAPAVQIFTLLHDVLSPESQSILRNYFLTAAAKRCKRYMLETEEFISSNTESFLTDAMTISTAYLKMKTLCLNISHEIEADIKIHNQHILPSSIDLPNISASLYSTELCKRLRSFLASCPPSKPSTHVTKLLIAAADFERNLASWSISPVPGGVVSKDLFHNYIVVWIQDTQLQLLDLCKAEKVLPYQISTHCATSPFVESMYDQIRASLNEYEVVINRWPQYLLNLESFVADIERAVMKALEKQYSDILLPLRDGIPKMIEKQVQKFTRKQSCISPYVVPNQLGTFLNTVKRILDVLHCRIEAILKSWASYLIVADSNPVFGEQMNAITVMLRKKYKKYMESIVEKLITNAQANRSTRLKRILEESKETEGETDIRERMQALSCSQLTDCIRNLYNVFSSRIFVAICRGLWDKMGQIVLSFLRAKETELVQRSNYALRRKLCSTPLDKDLDPLRSWSKHDLILSADGLVEICLIFVVL